MNCCICGKDAGKYGNNAEPVAKGRCCDACNIIKVIPTRVKQTWVEMPGMVSGKAVIPYDNLIGIPHCFQVNEVFKREYIILIRDGESIAFVKREEL